MAMSVKERQRRWKNRQAIKGNRVVTVSMTPEAYAALQAIRKETGCNFSTIINQSVTGNVVRCEATSTVFRASASPEPLPDLKDGRRSMGKSGAGRKTQAQIMIAALKLFAEKGYNATSVEDIIGEVGIARRTFYLHFKGKKEILSLLISKYQKVFTENIDVLGQLTFRKSQDEIKSILINGIQMLLDDQEMHWLTKLMLGELIGLQDTFSEIIDSTTEEVIHMTSEAIVRAQEDGTVSERLNPLVATFCLIGGFKEIMFQRIVRGRDFDLAESISLVVDLFAYGFFD